MMLEFSPPKMWVYGHHHVSFRREIFGTKFVGLAENEVFKIHPAFLYSQGDHLFEETQLILTEDATCQRDLHYQNKYPKVEQTPKTLKKEQRVLYVNHWNNLQGEYVRVMDMEFKNYYDLLPTQVKKLENHKRPLRITKLLI